MMVVVVMVLMMVMVLMPLGPTQSLKMRKHLPITIRYGPKVMGSVLHPGAMPLAVSVLCCRWRVGWVAP